MVKAMPPPDADTRLLVVAPHPDDETLGCAELMQAVRDAGGEVAIVLLTDGEANPWPQRWIERRWRLDAADRRRWGALRQGEMRSALQCMGLDGIRLIRFGWPDLGITARLLDPHADAVAALQREIRAFAPSMVLGPDLADRHPDHGSAHVLLRLALHALGASAPCLLGYGLHGGVVTDGGWQLPAVDTDWTLRKRVAMECYASQLRLGGGRFRRLVRRPEIYLSPPPAALTVNGRVRLPWRPGRLARRAGLRLMARDAGGLQSWPWDRAPLARRKDGGYDLQRQDRPWSEGPCFLRLESGVGGPWIFDTWGWWCIGPGDVDV